MYRTRDVGSKAKLVGAGRGWGSYIKCPASLSQRAWRPIGALYLVRCGSQPRLVPISLTRLPEAEEDANHTGKKVISHSGAKPGLCTVYGHILPLVYPSSSNYPNQAIPPPVVPNHAASE